MTTSGTKTRALCVATRCTTVDQFVATFHRFCGDDQSFFVATMTSRPIGLETPFSIQLADKQPVLRGLCIVLDAWDTFLIHCEGYPEEGWRASLTVEQAKEFLTANQVTAEDFWIDYPGVTAKEINKALALQQTFQQVLDNPGAAEALQHPALEPLLDSAAD